MELLLQPLRDLEAFQILKEKMKKGQGPFAVGGITEEQKVHFLYALTAEEPKQRLIVTYNEWQAAEWVKRFSFYEKGEVLEFPAKDMIFYQADVRSQDIVRLRLKVLQKLLSGEKVTIVCTLDALKDPLLPKEFLWGAILHFEVGQKIAREELIQRLYEIGYERVPMVEDRGQFAVRGGIFDVFSPLEDMLIRLEFFDDELDSIRLVNPETQRSIENIEMATLFPNREIILQPQMQKKAMERVEADYQATKKLCTQPEAAERLKKTAEELLEKIEYQGSFAGIEGNVAYFYEQTVSLADYFTDPIFVLDEPIRMLEAAQALQKEYKEFMENRFSKGYLLQKQMQMNLDYRGILLRISGNQTLQFSSLYSMRKDLPYQEVFQISGKETRFFQYDFSSMIKELKNYLSQKYRIVLLVPTGAMRDKMKELLEEQELPVFLAEKSGTAIPGKIALALGKLSQGFLYDEIRFAVFTESEGSHKKKRNKRKTGGEKIRSFYDLKPGDYVVHESHGIGIFIGMETIATGGMARDFIKIKYRDDGNLFIPTTQLDRIQKYIGGEGIEPKLNKLGGQEWKRTVQKAKKAIDEMVDELIELYAHRERAEGYFYSPDSVWQKEFEEQFPYEETQDQLNAIADMKTDMSSPKIMDRLICGDVGYGKTEVAIRGAFKAIQDSKQVAFLVPTTILAQQHYHNFMQRFKDYPVRIGVLSRFSTPKQTKQILEDMRSGVLDLVVGTHRLLSKDVQFKDLGLLIIDEEQRFGVKHKEAMKQLKENIDVLTLTATPIPRTLHMSLIGIRDMSVLEEAPHERQPIQTYVLEEDEILIRDAIYRELHRQGQVYYVYNRVRNIEETTARIQKMIPEAVVAFAHGQMSEKELESVMLAFIQGEIDVLVATSIIETGLDIPNVNTIMIQDADRMGLSQLYQLRGRVGRSSRVAYAYFLYRRNKVLQEVAEKRLKAIREFTELGAGFRIAMRDLEIRGAGNVLGTRQSGHLDAIGYEMYSKLVSGSIHSKRNPMERKADFDTTIDLKMDAYIPPEYIAQEEERLVSYKKMASIHSEEDYLDLTEELIDRYGDMPKSVRNLLEIGYLKSVAHQIEITEIRIQGKEMVFEVLPNAAFDGMKLLSFLEKNRQIQFRTKVSSAFYWKMDSGPILHQIKFVLQELKTLRLD